MIIKELQITSFGKFQNKIIKFDKGINLIYGLNESGKSTIHKFIEGMIFGFYRPSSVMRLLSDDYHKYYPRNYNSFAGSMIVEFEKRELRIERDFDNNPPSLKVFDNITGDDISKTLPEHSGTKLPDLASYLGISHTLYKDTISISQMENETSKDLANVVGVKLANLQTTKTETISIPSVISKLNQEKGEIGSRSARTRPYFKVQEQLKTLNEELVESVDKHKLITGYQQQINDLKEEELIVAKDLGILRNQRAIYNNENLKSIYMIVKNLKTNKFKLLNEINELEKFKEVNETEYEDAIKLAVNIDILNKSIKEQTTSKQELETNKKDLENRLLENKYLSSIDINTLNIENKYYAYVSDKSRLDNLTEELKRMTNVDLDKEVYEDIHDDYSKFNEVNSTNYNLDITQLNYEIMNNNQRLESFNDRLPNPSLKILYYILIPLIIGIFLLISHNKQTKNINKRINKVQNRLAELNSDFEKVKEKEKSQEEINKEIFIKYGVSSKDEFRALYLSNRSAGVNQAQIDSIRENITSLDKNIRTKIEELESIFKGVINTNVINNETFTLVKNEIANHKDLLLKLEGVVNLLSQQQFKLDKDNKELKEELDKFNHILTLNNVEDMLSFKESVEKKNEYKKLLSSIKSIDERIEDQLKDKSFDELEASIDFDLNDDYDKELYESILPREKDLQSKHLPIVEELSQLNEFINQIETTYRQPAIIEDDIELTKQLIEEFDLEIASIDLAVEILDAISDEIRYDFAPTLNKEISKIINEITSGKYNDVKIDKDMNVKVHEAATNLDVELQGFSMGTIDQLYLSMRLGINKTITERTYPLILDDPFVNYDNERLKNVLKVLSNQSKNENRQMILFTCHKREGEIFKELDVKHLVINI